MNADYDASLSMQTFSAALFDGRGNYFICSDAGRVAACFAIAAGLSRGVSAM
jgi:hypothetical protein